MSVSRPSHCPELPSEAGQILGFLCEGWAGPMYNDDHRPYGGWEEGGAEESN